MTGEGLGVPQRSQTRQRFTSVVWLSLLIYSHSVLQMNGLAAQGRYEGSGDGGAAAQSLYVANHAY